MGTPRVGTTNAKQWGWSRPGTSERRLHTQLNRKPVLEKYNHPHCRENQRTGEGRSLLHRLVERSKCKNAGVYVTFVNSV